MHSSKIIPKLSPADQTCLYRSINSVRRGNYHGPCHVSIFGPSKKTFHNGPAEVTEKKQFKTGLHRKSGTKTKTLNWSQFDFVLKGTSKV